MAQFDLFVIGGGSGGVAAARRAASYGAKVAIAEASRFGGTCVIRGCVPKKLMSYAGHFAESAGLARGYGFEGELKLDFARLIAARNAEIARLEGIYQRLLDEAGVRRLVGNAAIEVERREGAFVIEVEGERLTTTRVLVATGGRPTAPDTFEGQQLTVSSDQLLEGTYPFPRRLAVVGAGYIGLEQASIFNALGADVSLVLRGDLPLRGFDEDLRRAVAEEIAVRGVTIRAGTRPLGARRDGDGLVLLTDQGEIGADAILLATGRSPRPNTRGLGLEAHGVRLNEAGAVRVDALYASNVENIFAVGDCCDHAGARVPGQYDLTPVAIAEGRALADRLFDGRESLVAYDTAPTAVFSDPQVATCGLTENEARDRGLEVVIFKTRFRPLLHTLSGRSWRTTMKLVVDKASERVLGCHIVGEDAAEMIQGMAAALTARITKRALDDTVALHPTAAEELVTLYKPATG